MSKYSPLRQHLYGLQHAEAVMSFTDIETIIGHPLPQSARVHRTWWANHGGNMVHQLAWVGAGWRVDDADLSRERVRFRRFKFSGTKLVAHSPPAPMARSEEAADRAVKHASIKAVEKASKPLTVGVRVMAWRVVGAAERRGDIFVVPGVPSGPGIIRFHVLDDGFHEIQVAAVLDMPAFVAAVGRPPMSRAGRSGAELAMAATLADAREIIIDCATADQVFIMVDGGSRKANFTDTAVRALLAAAVEIDGRPISKPRLSETG
jgi:hypothetical protein